MFVIIIAEKQQEIIFSLIYRQAKADAVRI